MLGVVCGCVAFCSSCVVCFLGVCGWLFCVRRVVYIVLFRAWRLVVGVRCLCVVCLVVVWRVSCVAYCLLCGVCCLRVVVRCVLRGLLFVDC